MRLNEQELIKIISETVKRVLKESFDEVIAGGNDWGNTYGVFPNNDTDYFNKNRERAVDDNLVRELHTILQYVDDVFYAVYKNKSTNAIEGWKQEFISEYGKRMGGQADIEKMWLNYLKKAYDLMDPIYGLMANRTNRKGDAQAMTVDDIIELKPQLMELSQMKYIMQPSNAARRLVRNLDSLMQ